jgi:hypothetical protein
MAVKKCPLDEKENQGDERSDCTAIDVEHFHFGCDTFRSLPCHRLSPDFSGEASIASSRQSRLLFRRWIMKLNFLIWPIDCRWWWRPSNTIDFTMATADGFKCV